jgi:hypothetical protein
MPVPDPFLVLDVFHDCLKIAIRWLLPVPDCSGNKTVDIQGIDILQVRPYKYKFQIEKAYSEYNNLYQIAAQDLCGERCNSLTFS